MIFKREQTSNYSHHVKPISPVATEQKGIFLTGYSSAVQRSFIGRTIPSQNPFLRICSLSHNQHAGIHQPLAEDDGLVELPWQLPGWDQTLVLSGMLLHGQVQVCPIFL